MSDQETPSIVSQTNSIVPIQSTENPGEVINPIPLVAEESAEYEAGLPQGKVVDRQVDILNPSFNPLEKAPDEVLDVMDRFGREVANTPENPTPVKLAGMITVHAVFNERMRRELVVKQQEAAVEDLAPKKFSKNYGE